jgi:hypothetical protein
VEKISSIGETGQLEHVAHGGRKAHEAETRPSRRDHWSPSISGDPESM